MFLYFALMQYVVSLPSLRFHTNIWDKWHFEIVLQKNKMHKRYQIQMLEEAKIYLFFPYGESLHCI